MNQAHKLLVVEGWRGINHSFALVNQFQLLEMAKRRDIDLRNVDAPFHFAHWNKATNGAGFHFADETILAGIPAPDTSRQRDWTYRIYSPIDLRPPQNGGRLAIFLVTELGLDEHSFVAGSDMKQFESAGHIIVTPSQWSRDRILDWGFQPGTIQVVPHAVNSDYFFPQSAQTIQAQRAALGFAAGEVLLLNVGAAIWNKGIDVLLKGFALARQQRKDLRLIFKDQRNTYGISGDTYVKSTLASAGLLSDDVSSAITLIPANLTMDQMNAMYNIADCYVSPYRAEGFNLPACEAMACGTPVLVTQGGATDDFVHGGKNRTVGSVLHSHTIIQGKNISAYREPDLDDLLSQLTQTTAKIISTSKPDAMTWDSPVNTLMEMMGPSSICVEVDVKNTM